MSSTRQDQRLEAFRELTKFAEVFARREAAKIEMLEDILPETLFKLIASTEGLGLIGEDLPILRKDWDLFRKAFRIYSSLRKRNPESELTHIKALIDDMAADLAARSRNILSIQPLLQAEQITERQQRQQRRGRPQVAGEGS